MDTESRDKEELDRRTSERERIREGRRQEERRKLEEAMKVRDQASDHQRDQLSLLEEKLGAPPVRQQHRPEDPVRSYVLQDQEQLGGGKSARDKVILFVICSPASSLAFLSCT